MDTITRLINFLYETNLTHQKFSDKFGITKHRLQRLIYKKQILTDEIKQQLDSILNNENNYQLSQRTIHAYVKNDVESKSRVCVKCHKTKPFLRGSKYKYTDGEGNWNGHTCYQCHKGMINDRRKNKDPNR